jgi:flagellar motor switch protein FliN/FliY
MDILQHVAASMDNFSDISVGVEARFEERLMDVRDVRAIQPGVVIALSHPAGETLSVCVGNVRLASAEVVVIEDRLALRITEIGRLDP